MESIKPFFNPDSVALIGATDRAGSAGRVILRNLLLARDRRKIYPINPGKEKVFGIQCYPDIDSVPGTPDVAIIAVPAEVVPDTVEGVARAGVKAIIIISAGFREVGSEGKAREDRIANIARKYNIRVMGPNCMGVIRPSANLNTTFTNLMPKPGYVAFLSQSGTLGSAVLDWATSKNLGFSVVVSLGSTMDVDFGDLIDYFGGDPETRSIIIYLESIANARKFISAARRFAATKPTIVLKPGKTPESVTAAKSHTGGRIGDDLYYDAIFRRAGVVRVEKIEDLFNCASILNTAHLPRGPHLAIVTNAGGPAVLATDALINGGGKLAQLSEATISALDDFLPVSWSRSNPVDMMGDASPQSFARTIGVTAKDPGVDGVVVIYTPQGGASPDEVAAAVIKPAEESGKPVLTSFMGEERVSRARKLFYDSKIPTYEFPEDAIRTYLYMYQYACNLEMLYETPEELPVNMGPSRNHLRVLIRNAVREGRMLLGSEESKKFLTTYGIPSATSYVAGNPDEAVRIASLLGYPVVMKINSPDVSHKSDVGGVILNVPSASEVKKVFAELIENVKGYQPDARIDGVSVQRMVTNYNYELVIRSQKDPVFGPVIMLGQEGMGEEFLKGVATGLPPLNQVLARMLVEQTRVYKLLSQRSGARPVASLRLLEEALVGVSNLISDFPEIKELDINPLALSTTSIGVLDAKIVLDECAMRGEVGEYAHLIISPYPTRYVQPWTCKDGRQVLLRPVRPEDEPLEKELLSGLSEEVSRLRFFYRLKHITHEMLIRFCNIDYDREMAIIAEYSSGGKKRSVGDGRLVVASGEEEGEIAVLVADDFQNNGMGIKISDMLVGIAQEKGLKCIFGIVLNDNSKMLGLFRKLGFTIEKISPEESKASLEF